ncbi:MAG: DMT family transporter [Chloroflexi bacterium]|nr:DMT family transporter [Chloroflexota bacterium]MCY3584041.1 DMT family transporter [Chloroflexota bacterium]MXV92832.1 DMT family transporter [Chloroflexota bacterium]MXX82907.1 DMT family transporter [Chloroflexota bacterium]MYA92316.1 DMT family transporter [Chloroflexota bacterium]
MSTRERAGIVWVLLAACGFSIMPSLVKITYAHSTFSPMDIAIWRFLLAVPLMWALVLLSRRKAPRKLKSDAPVRQAWLIGMMLSVAVLSAFFGLERLPGSTYIVLFYSYPALVVLLSRLLGESIGARAWLALGLALTGVVLTVPDFQTVGGVDRIGVALALANAAIVAVYYLLSKRALAGVVDVSGASAWMMLGTLFVLALLVPLRGLQMPANAQTLLMLLAIASFCTVLPVFGINLAIQRIGAARASLVSTVEPPMSMLVSMFVLGELILAVQWLGAGLIIGSVIVLQLRPRNRLDISIAHEAG